MNNPWKELEKYKNKEIKGEWPTITEMFNIVSDIYPNNRVFSTFGTDEIILTYNQSRNYISKISNFLLGLGLQKGDHIAVYGKNSPQWAIAYLSILNIGGVVIPIDNGLNAKEVVDLLDLSDSKALFSEKEKLDYINENTPKSTYCFSLNPDIENYILDLDNPDNFSITQPMENDIAAILYTSGTTGVSKGVMLSHKNFSSDVLLAQGNLKVYSTDVFYALLPIHHSYTMTSVFLEAIYSGAEIVFGKQLVFSQIIKDFEKGKVTMFLGVPMLFNKIINGLLSGVRKKSVVLYGIIRFLMSISGFIKKTFNINPGKKMFKFLLKKAALQNIRICISGGGPLAPSTFKLFNQLGIDFVQGYGLTEASPMLALNPVEKYKETSVGKILPQIDVKIINIDDDGNGEIIAKGPNIMQGYYKNTSETQLAFTEDGYLITGDIGSLDTDNYLYLTGRKSSLIVTEGGKNVYPEELEDEFQLYNQFEQVLVKGYIKNKKTISEGIEILFYPTKEFTQNKTNEQIKQFFENIVAEKNKSLISYKRLDRVYILLDELPMTTTKKIKRNEVICNYEKLSKY